MSGFATEVDRDKNPIYNFHRSMSTYSVGIIALLSILSLRAIDSADTICCVHLCTNLLTAFRQSIGLVM